MSKKHKGAKEAKGVKKGKRTQEESREVARPERGIKVLDKAHHHAYLNAIGIPSTDSCVFNTTDDTDGRQGDFLADRAIHSLDERETWSLDYTLMTWLYEHLMCYLEFAGGTADLSCGSFDVEDIRITKKGKVKRGIVRLDKAEAIGLACKHIRKSLTCDWDDKARNAHGQAALRIVAELLPSLWW